MRLLLIAAALQVGAFSPSGDGRPPSRLHAEGDAKPKDPIVSAAGWPRVKALLDRLPVFTVANEQGQPLQYEADGKPLALLYADAEGTLATLHELGERVHGAQPKVTPIVACARCVTESASRRP